MRSVYESPKSNKKGGEEQKKKKKAGEMVYVKLANPLTVQICT